VFDADADNHPGGNLEADGRRKEYNDYYIANALRCRRRKPEAAMTGTLIHHPRWKRPGEENTEHKTSRVHWHAAFTHFPISLFGAAFLFQVLHLFMFRQAFELSTTVCVLFGAASMVPAIASGWFTWKRQYHGARARIIRRKIGVAFGMLGVSVALSVWRVILYYLGSEAEGIDHYAFFAFSALLIAGAVLEGFYGGRLAHREGDVTCEAEGPSKKEFPKVA
jgi:uncharacterized membrane protein